MTTRLFVNYYTPPDARRRWELEECLGRNLGNARIDQVVVLAQGEAERRREFDSPKIAWHEWPSGKRPTFAEFFGLVNRQVDDPRDLSIVANSDIFFDETIALLKGCDLEHTCCALTRWEWHADRPPDLGAGDHSQDAWVFQGRIRPLGNCDFTMGMWACDNRLAWELIHGDYRVINPCHDVKAFHVHDSGVRTPYENAQGPGEYVKRQHLRQCGVGPARMPRCGVIAMSLYGDARQYTAGAIENARLARHVYPGWTLRFYHDETVPPEVLQTLAELKTELIRVPEPNQGVSGMFWRHAVADDLGFARWMVRDADSRLNYRERRAVDEWIESGAPFHVMRDHPCHGKPIMGCGFGGVRGVVTGTQAAIDAWENQRDYGIDESFLEHHFWPRVKERALIHDAYATHYGGNVRPFPTARECWRFVGERCYHDEHWNHNDRILLTEAPARSVPPPAPAPDPVPAPVSAPAPAPMIPAPPVDPARPKRFSVLIGCYGPHFEYSSRAIRSVLQCAGRWSFDVLVGCSACEPRTVSLTRQLLDDGKIDLLIESPANINKDPMMRLLIDRVTTPYFLWMDDDSHVLAGWDEAMGRFIESHHMSFECAGHVYYSHRSPEYLEYLHRRPWWVGADHYMEPGHREIVWFATGGLFLARTEFLRLHNFPDRGMIKKQDDLLLGDLISQHKGRLINFPDEIMKLIRISDGERRGSGEGSDGWRNIDPP